MSWDYEQSSGRFFDPEGIYIGDGYSGIGLGLNNDSDQQTPNEGPIPQGQYSIGQAFTHPQCGPLSMRLDPINGTDTFGRSGFLIHGDSTAMNHTASHGCVILSHDIRQLIENSTDRVLLVSP
jgi:hypothetical protein